MARPEWLPPWLLNRRVLYGAGLFGTVLVVLGVTFLLEDRSNASLAAIQTTTTILLVFITGVYAYLTFRLVKLQENPPFIYRAAEQEAVSELMNLLLTDRVPTNQIVAKFPLEINDPLPPEWLTKGVSDIEGLAGSLQRVAWRLPLRLQGPALASIIEILMAANAYLALGTTWMKTATQDFSSGIDVGAVREAYEQVYIVSSPPTEYPSWIELLRGDPIKAVDDGLTLLRNRLLEYSLEQKGAKR